MDSLEVELKSSEMKVDGDFEALSIAKPVSSGLQLLDLAVEPRPGVVGLQDNGIDDAPQVLADRLGYPSYGL